MSKKKYTHLLTVKVNAEIDDQLDELCEFTGSNMSELVRGLIATAHQNMQRKKNAATADETAPAATD